jgi:hypothetical protein
MKEEKETQPVRVWEATVKNSKGVYDFLYFAANDEEHARRKAGEEGEEVCVITEIIPEAVAFN